MKRRKLIAAMLAAPAAAMGLRPAGAAPAFIDLGSGSTRGLYYPTAATMADIVNDADVPIRAYVHATGASVDNCRQIGSGQLQMGLTQSNIAWYAYHGSGIAAFEGKPERVLRGMLMLYPEVIHILVRRLAGISSVADLRGKRVYVGDTGSGTVEDVNNVLAAAGLTTGDLRAAVRGNAGDAVNLLVDAQIDALFYTVGVGARAIAQALDSGQVDLLDVPAQLLAALHGRFPFYTALTLPAGTYRGIAHPVSTITLRAMLVTTSSLPADAVQGFMDTVFVNNLERFYDKTPNPNLKRYFKLETALEGMPIPLHAGAEAFFRARGQTIPDALRAP